MALFETAAADSFLLNGPRTTYVPASCTQDAGIQGSLRRFWKASLPVEEEPRWISNHDKSRVRRRFC